MLLVSSETTLPQRRCCIYCRANSLTKTLKEILPYYFHKTEAIDKFDKAKTAGTIRSITVAVEILPLAQELQVER